MPLGSLPESSPHPYAIWGRLLQIEESLERLRTCLSGSVGWTEDTLEFTWKSFRKCWWWKESLKKPWGVALPVILKRKNYLKGKNKMSLCIYYRDFWVICFYNGQSFAIIKGLKKRGTRRDMQFLCLVLEGARDSNYSCFSGCRESDRALLSSE